jgi:hypothetical protein
MIFDIILMFARYAPFWGIPMAIISGELCYIFWMRDKKKVSVVFTFTLFISLAFVILYYYFGGSEKFARAIIQFYQYLTS